MEKITYKSAGGTVVMGGGADAHINLIEKSGFGLPSKRYDEIKFVGEHGVTTTGSSDFPRTLTITGDLYGGQAEIRQMLEAFYHDGDLYCDFGPDMRRKISCKLLNADDIINHCKSGINTFTLQFQADYPYYNDFEDTVVSLSSYKNHVTETFELPCVFTELIQQGSAYNYGNKQCYGVITLTSAYEPTVENGVITVSNLTTGKSIHLNHTIQKDETVEIDLNTRRIVSSVSGRITNAITDDTEMSDFYLELGLNKISFHTNDTLQPMTATLRYNNIYLVAVDAI